MPLLSLLSPGPYSYCNVTLDQIGTCWPRSAAGALVERPCPEYFNGVKYNSSSECPGPSAAGFEPASWKGGLGRGEGPGLSVGEVLRAAPPSDRRREDPS